MAKKSNWSRLKDQKFEESVQGRDVYDEQQLGRGKLQEKQTMFSRMVVCIVAGVSSAILTYVIWAGVAPMVSTYNSATTQQTAEKEYTPVEDQEGVAIYHESDNTVTTLNENGESISVQLEPQADGTSIATDVNDSEKTYVITKIIYDDGCPAYNVETGEDGTPKYVPVEHGSNGSCESGKGGSSSTSNGSTSNGGSGSNGYGFLTEDHTSGTGDQINNGYYWITGEENTNVYGEKGSSTTTSGSTSGTSGTSGSGFSSTNSGSDSNGQSGTVDPMTTTGYAIYHEDGSYTTYNKNSGVQVSVTLTVHDDGSITATDMYTNTYNITAIVYDNGSTAQTVNSDGTLTTQPKQETSASGEAIDFEYEYGVVLYDAKSKKCTTVNEAGNVINVLISVNEDGKTMSATEIIPEESNGETSLGKVATREPEVIPVTKVVYADGCEAAIVKGGQLKTLEHTYDTANGCSESIDGKFTLKPHSMWQVLWSLMVGLSVFAALYQVLKRNLDAQNMLADTEDINQYTNDQHIALPEEIQRKYDWFPDIGMHTDVGPSTLLSHVMVQNKGINPIMVSKRYDKDILNEDGDVVHYKGEIMLDENDNPIQESKPLFDTEFADALFDASNQPKAVRKSYDARLISYNPDNANRDKIKGKKPSDKLTDKVIAKITKKPIKEVSKFDTVADLINNEWEMPDYEVHRPAGAYIVDTAPVNTMVLAMTRAGKGQTIIEPTIDMWTREKRQNNIVVNDPKGELLVKFYVTGTYRNFQIVQFNLINSMKTDIYNPLGMAAQSAREGDFTKCAMYVENIAEVFFPLDGGDDPVWPNAANNAFKRAAYGLIDYYLEEEHAYRKQCEILRLKGVHIDAQTIETHIDEMWGRVTLYNCYQMFTQLTSKKLPNPAKEFAQKMKNGEYEGVPEDVITADAERANVLSDIWVGAPEADCLTLYFNATEKLPKNSMRNLINNVNNALKSMAGAEKMLASVYGIAITAMSFFTDPTISTLTSGTPSQTVDLAGYSFPRRCGVRFHPDFIKKNHYVGLQCKWDAFEDKQFTKPLGKLFEHSDIVSREGWARYYFDGKFKTDKAYVRLRLMNASTGVLVHTYYFEFNKGYQMSLDGRTFVKDPILHVKIAKNGTLTELMKNGDEYKFGNTLFKRKTLVPENTSGADIDFGIIDDKVSAITQTYVRYSEKAKMTFLVTPPHLMKYAKLILILIKQLFDLNVDQSYMTKENQKPLYKTRYMLDELGNLQSEGHGISGFETMLSIGLGQEQQYTLILQTLQQLKDVYGDSVDKIVQGNTSNIIFLKSTDDSMLETLEKMSGKTHKSFIDQKTVTRDMEKIWMANEGKASYMMQTKEVPVISYNDMAFIGERNSIVFRAGDSPIWNKNETILPMSWRLFSDTLTVPGKKYSLQTIPTLSSAVDFDLKGNQPDFDMLLKKRMEQAIRVDKAVEAYKMAFSYDDDDINRLDVDVYAADIMDMISTQIEHEKLRERYGDDVPQDEDTFISEEEMFADLDAMVNAAEENTEVLEAVETEKAKTGTSDAKIYAHGMISKSDLVHPVYGAQHGLDNMFVEIYRDITGDMNRDPMCRSINGGLYAMDGVTPYIVKESSADVNKLRDAISDENSNVYSEEDITDTDLDGFVSWRVTDEFYKFLASMQSWSAFANGKFEEAVSRKMSVEDVA